MGDLRAIVLLCWKRKKRTLLYAPNAPIVIATLSIQSAVAARIELADNPGFHDPIQGPRCEDASRFSEQSSRMAAPTKSRQTPEMTREEVYRPHCRELRRGTDRWYGHDRRGAGNSLP